MLRQFLMSALLVCSIVPAGSAIAQSVPTVSCVKTSETFVPGKGYRYTCLQMFQGVIVDKWIEWRSAVKTCTIDASGGYNCSDSGSSLPPGTVINPRIAIVPRSERDPKLPTIDSRQSLQASPTIVSDPKQCPKGTNVILPNDNGTFSCFSIPEAKAV